MRNVVLLSGMVFALSMGGLRAGNIVSLQDRPEMAGKLIMSGNGVRVESSFPNDVGFGDILEANFTETPFELESFSSSGTTQIPADWQKLDVGDIKPPGSFSYEKGVLTLTGSGNDEKKEKAPVYFFMGHSWKEDGQWTFRVKEVDAKVPTTEVGVMLRESMAPDASAISLGTGLYRSKISDGPMALFRAESAATRKHGAKVSPTPVQLPVWLRLTQSGLNMNASISKDGTEWELIGQQDLKNWAGNVAGFYITSHQEDTPGHAVVDQIDFTPGPSLSQVIPSGALLSSGTSLAGKFSRLNLSTDAGDATASFTRNGTPIEIPPSKITAIILNSTPRNQIADANSKTGVIMKNGDFLDGEIQTITGTEVNILSALLGLATYKVEAIQAGVLHPLRPQPANYEVRLKDGSSILANNVSGSGTQLNLEEVSGITVSISTDEVAQFRAGPARVQSLLNLPWTSTPATPAPAAPAADATPAAAPDVSYWEGNNQEQIMVAPTGTPITFPLAGRFRALALRIALAPGCPPNAQVVVRILADGNEIGRTPPFHAGEAPRFAEVGLQDPKKLTLVAESPFGGTRVLYIDPVAIRR